MTSAAQQLARATAVLEGTVPVPADQRLIAAAHPALQVLVDNEVGVLTRLAWTGLSAACHRHAFELPPAEGEIRALIAQVGTVIETV